jgi:predicted porin
MEIYRMKKSLFAVAALTAVAGAAQAQSSVTVYGILDVGYIGSNTRDAGPTTVAKSTGNQFSSSAEQTSRLGFKGTEDLGGGTSAFFTIETTVTPNATTVLGGTRQAFVGLKKNGLGQASIGTVYTPIHVAVGNTDPGQQNNISGNLIYATYTGPAVANASASAGNTDAYTVRTANTLKFESDKFAGFSVNAVLTGNNQNNNQTTTVSGTTTTVTGGLNNQSGWGLGVDYTWQKLLVTANYQAYTSKNAYTYNSAGTTGAAMFPVGGPAAWTTATGGTNVQDNQAYIAGTYDFGILKAYAQWVSRKVSDQQNSNYYLKRQAQQIGVRSFLTPTIEAWASAGNGRYTAFGQGNPTANIVGFQLGSNYWLSKRTNLYAIYGQSGTSNVSGQALVNNATANPVSYNTNAYAVGVRHTF